MQFNSGKEMLDYLINCGDLYSKDKEIYVFDYNLNHSIAYYYIDNEKMKELWEEAKENSMYVGGLLGIGGYIVDDPSYEGFEEGDYSNLDWCNDNYIGEWDKIDI